MATLPRRSSAPLRCSRYSSVLESAFVSVGREDAVVSSTRKSHKKRRWKASKSPVVHLRKVLSAPEQQVGRVNNVKNVPHDELEHEQDPFSHFKPFKSIKKKKVRRPQLETVAMSPVVTRSASKEKNKRPTSGVKNYSFRSVLELAGRTPVTRSMVKEKKTNKRKRDRLERIDDVAREEEEKEKEEDDAIDDVVVKKRLFHSPVKTKPRVKNNTNTLTCPKVPKNSKPKSTVLENWGMEWPPHFDKRGGKIRQKARLVLTGRLHGHMVRFPVQKRLGAMKFVSQDGEIVTLAGQFDWKAATSDRVPHEAMELMRDGIPAFFQKRFLPFVQQTPEQMIQDKTRRNQKANKKKSSSRMPSNEEKSERKGKKTVDSIAGETHNLVKVKKRRITKDKPPQWRQHAAEPEAEDNVWSSLQLEALKQAKLKIPTTAANFWVQVAHFVPGKSAAECQAKTFEHFRSPPRHRQGVKKSTKQSNSDSVAPIPSKIARAGSNKFKKQVREFVHEYEKKHVDDLFETTPSKEGVPELPEFDTIRTPELDRSTGTLDDDESSELMDDAPNLSKTLSSRRRDDIDSYVLGINRLHVAGGGVKVGGKVRRVTSKNETHTELSTKKKAVTLVSQVRSHSLKGIVSPGGTARVCIEKDESLDDEDEENSSEEEEEEEENFDLV